MDYAAGTTDMLTLTNFLETSISFRMSYNISILTFLCIASLLHLPNTADLRNSFTMGLILTEEACTVKFKEIPYLNAMP